MTEPPLIPNEPAGADAAAASRLARAADRSRDAPDIPALEWIFAAIGFALVAATIAFIAWRGYSRNEAPPQIAFEVISIDAVGEAYLVKIRALNRGGETAADVQVEAELRGPAGTVEKSASTFKYLPPHSPRTGGLYFARDPRALELVLSAKGYEAP